MMEFDDYQREALRTDQVPRGVEHGAGELG